MNYKVMLFTGSGDVYKGEDVTAKNHAEAATKSVGIVRVQGKTTKRFVGGKEIKEIPQVYSVVRNKRPAILLMFGRLPEFAIYPYTNTRDKAYEECIKLLSAESVKPSLQQIDTIVYSGAISASDIGLTVKKTSSGYAGSVINLALETPSSIASAFGSAKYVATDKDGWKTGYNNAPSKSPTKYFGKIDVKYANKHEWPMLNEHMKAMDGETVLFTEASNTTFGTYYRADKWHWNKKWINTRYVPLKVKTTDDVIEHPFYSRYAGQVMRFTKCNCGCDNYHSADMYIPVEYLEIPEAKSDRQTMETGGTKDSSTPRGGESASDGQAEGFSTGYIASYPFAGGKAQGKSSKLVIGRYKSGGRKQRRK